MGEVFERLKAGFMVGKCGGVAGITCNFGSLIPFRTVLRRQELPVIAWIKPSVSGCALLMHSRNETGKAYSSRSQGRRDLRVEQRQEVTDDTLCNHNQCRKL